MLSYFNRLPPRTHYIDAVLKALSIKPLTLYQIQNKTGLTRTQTACALDKLLHDKKIKTYTENGKNYYGINQVLY